MNPRHRAFLSWCLLLWTCAVTTSCQPYRIEHVKRPGFYQKASKDELPTQITLEDGTVVQYESPSEVSTLGRAGKDAKKVFEPREEVDDPMTGGKKVILRAILPEHVILNTLNCIRNEEYDLLWEQGLAKRTKDNYAAQAADTEEDDLGQGRFAAFMRKYRHELAATLTRMMTGMSGQDVAIDHLSDGMIRCRLRPQVADPFVFKSVDMAKEDGWLKLVLIQ